jgi:hypothetical protein
MYQKEIEFFWPLTEQIQLDLDYSRCVKPSVTANIVNGGTSIAMVSPSNLTWTTTVTASEISTERLTLAVDKSPNFMRKWLYKLLDIKWKIK